MTKKQKDKLWRDRLPHLHYLPNDVRVMAIQAGIQTWGPVPDELGDEARRLLDPKTPVEPHEAPAAMPGTAEPPVPRKVHAITASSWRSRWRMFRLFQKLAWRLLFRGHVTIKL